MKNRTFPVVRTRAPRRRRGRTRLFVLGAAFVAAAGAAASADAGSAPAVAQQARPSGGGQKTGLLQDLRSDVRAGESSDVSGSAIRFDIEPATLDVVLAEYQRITGIRPVLADVGLGAIRSPGVSGTFTAAQAMERLLAGTSAGAVFAADNTVKIGLGGLVEFVEVAGRAPTASSPKYTEPLRDIPQTINVIPQSLIQEQGATTLRDVLRNVVGITFQAGEGGVPAGDQLTIRGFSARTDMFIDGVRDFGGYARDPFNLEQVEVSKGPSSAISGRGSTGGAINQVSKVPRAVKSYDVSFGGGNGDYKRTSADVNQPIGAAVALRVNAMWTDTGVPGRDVVKSQRWGVAPSLVFGVTSPSRLTISHLHLDQDNIPEYGLPWVPANTNPVLADYANGQPPVDSSNFYGLTTRDYEDTSTDVTTAQLDHRVSAVLSLRNLARYGRNDRDSVITSPRFASVNTGTAVNRQLQSRDMVDTIVANQTSAIARFGTGPAGHAVSAGLEISHETSENFARSGPTAPVADLFNPNPSDPYPGPITRTGASTKGVANSIAAYAFDTVSVGERLELSGGLRWERFEAEADATATTGVVTPFGRIDHIVSWRAGAVFKPRSNGSLYVGYGTSANPSAEGLALSASLVELDPEQTRNYEVGTKWDVMGGRLSANAAVFRTEKTNARTTGINPGDPPTVLAGEQLVSGLEVGVSGRVTRQWSVFSGYAFMDSAIEASNVAGELDSALALTPKHTLSLWTTYELPWHVSIGGGAQYMDAVFRNATNTAEVPSYWLTNALVSYKVNDHLTLRMNGQNLADTEYVDRVGGGHYVPGPGRQILLSTDFRF